MKHYNRHISLPLGFVLVESNFPTLWDLLISSSESTVFRHLDTEEIITASVYSVLISGKSCTNTQFCLYYCFCLSIFCSWVSILLDASIRFFSNKHVFSSFSFLPFFVFIFFLFFFFLFSYSPNLTLMKSITSYKSVRCNLLLI